MVDILMATYNGELYLEEQIKSIIKQSYKNWILYIRDDGSKDNTLKIINRYTYKYPDKIKLIADDRGNLGSNMNFKELMQYSKNEYCMFCDQDDVWLEDKIKLSLDKIKKLENKYGKNTPILVHTDLKVVNEKLDEISESFWEYIKLNPSLTSINNLLVRNNITGCTIIMNNKLKEYSKKISVQCCMHDWWIALVESSMGKIGIINQPTILYRQHNNNQVGATINTGLMNKIGVYKNIHYMLKSSILYDRINQAKAFYKQYRDDIGEKNRIIIEQFIEIENKNKFVRKLIINRNKFYTTRPFADLQILLFG